jgi:hypothetical protein
MTLNDENAATPEQSLVSHAVVSLKLTVVAMGWCSTQKEEPRAR